MGGIGRGRRGAILAAMAIFPAGVAAQTRPPSPPAVAPNPGAPSPTTPSPPKQADAAFEAARTAFEALPETERKGLQDALVWTGDFNAVVSGAFGRRTFEALQAFAARTRASDPLSAEGRRAIRAAGDTARKAASFRNQTDPVSGVSVGVPEAVLTKRTALPSGTRWQSADGRVTLETRTYPPEAETLEGLFARATAPLNGRRVTYRLQKPDLFVVSAETANGLSYTRYAAGPQGIRGMLIGYDRALATDVNRLVIAIANAFDPFPAENPPARIAERPAPPAPPVQASAAARVAATGLVVAPGRVLTAGAALQGCVGLRVGDQDARVVASDPSGLALIEAAGLQPVSLTVATSAAEAVTALTAGAQGVAAVPGSVADGRVTAPLQPGAAGAPLFDRQGRLTGLVASYPGTPRLVAGVAPPMSLPVVPATSLAAFLAQNGIAPGGAKSAGIAEAVPAVKGLTCR